MGSSIVFLGDQFPMPSQQSLGRDNAGDFGKNLSSQRFGLYGQSPALMVIEAHSPVTELFSKHPILLAKIFNDLALAVVHPPGNSDQHKPERVDPGLSRALPEWWSEVDRSIGKKGVHYGGRTSRLGPWVPDRFELMKGAT
jgi:hypothetical protein